MESFIPFAAFAQAQEREFSVTDAVGIAGAPIPLIIDAPERLSKGIVFASISGLPTGFSLSAGFATADVWVVALKDLQWLTVTAPPGFAGEVTLTVSLIRSGEGTLAVRKLKLTIKERVKPAEPAATQASSTATPPPAATLAENSKARAFARLPEDKGRTMIERAKKLLDNNDVGAARLLFEKLAQQGSPEGAFLIAQTFDPNFLAQEFQKFRSLAPDAEKAKRWYRTAKELGHPQADARLQALKAK